MKTLHTIIVDDEPRSVEYLKRCCVNEPTLELLQTFDHGQAAIDGIRELQPNLVLLDIQMRDISGLEVVRQIGVDKMPLTIFVTGFDRYAVQAFDLNAVDYLLKPFDELRFKSALQRVQTRFNQAERQPQSSWRNSLSAALEALGARSAGRGFVLVERAGRHFPVRMDAIEAIEASGNYVVVHHPPEKSIIRGRMLDAEQWVQGEPLLRVHRSWLINLQHLQTIAPNSTGDFRITLKSGTYVDTGRRFRRIVVDLIHNRR